MSTKRLWWVAAAALLALAGCDDPADPGEDGGDTPMTDGGGQSMTDAGSADLCEDVADACTTAGTRCDGTTLVTCAVNDDGCLVETTKSCTALNQICDDSGAEAECAPPPVDPCADVPAEDLCETEGARACDEGTLEVCAMNAAGCLVLERTECDAAEGGVCDESGDMPVCVAPVDPCASIPAEERCTAEGTTCDGDNLVTCAPDAFGCLVETATDCSAATDGTCEGTPAMCTFTGDACEGVTQCAAEGISCDGPDLVECAPDAFGCLVETRTTCTDAMFGFCDADAATPMCSTAASDPCLGETQCGTEITRACNGDGTAVESCVPNAFGCFVEATTTCASNEVCSEDGGAAACGPADPNCPAAEVMVLDCASGTVSGDTAMGAANINNYECKTFNYPGHEQIWRFENADRAVVTVSATQGSGSGDYDLYVLDGSSGAMCDSGLTCLDSSTSSSSTETVEFIAEAGATNYVVYDKYSSSGTTDYTLQVSCEPIVCGDSVLTGDETCEDGNTAAGDGCSDTCQVEPGYECETLGSACTFVCGNGVIDASESCDDGNTAAGDGCSATCEIEPDTYCSGEPSVCAPMVCGDGLVVGSEECDDANTTAGDGCSDTCEIEDGYVCDGEGAGSCTVVAHGVCSGARVITGTSSFAREPIDAGGPRPRGDGCGDTFGNGDNALYYAVTIPAMTTVHVATSTPDGSLDRVLLVQDSCGATSCSYRTDSSPEKATLTNATSADITQIVAIHNYYSTGTGTFDIDFTYAPLAANATCAGARVVTGSTSFAGEDIERGGSRPEGTGCGTSSGDNALYYAVTIPPSTAVDVTTATPVGSLDRVLLVQDSCGATSCSYRTDTAPERATLANTTSADITQIVAIHNFSSTGTGTFDIDFAYRPLAANAGCSGATPLTGTLVGEDLAGGGAPPTGSSCGSTAGPVLYYSVTVPANSTATVTATPTGATSWNLTLRSLEDCSGDCLGNVNAESSGVAETIELVNLTSADETRLIAVGASSATTYGTFDIGVTTAAIAYAANATCAGATPLVAGTPITDEDTAGGGAAPTGATCDTTGAQTLYYEVTVPAGQVGTVAVAGATGLDAVVMALDSCGAADCSASVDRYGSGGTETLTIGNVGGAADLTRVVAVNAYAADRTGTFDIELTLETPVPGTMCAAAIPVTADASFTGLHTDDGGAPHWGAGCGRSTSAPSEQFYYAVTIEPGQRVTVTLSGNSDLDGIINVIDGCAATGCSDYADSTYGGGVETIDIDNGTGAAITRIVAVGDWFTDGGSFGVEFAFTPIP